MTPDPNDLLRHPAHQRFIHWVTALSVILLALSGLAFFHPMFWPLVHLFGGGTWARILHPYLGIFMVLFFAALCLTVWDENFITSADRAWLSDIGRMAGGDDRDMPEQGMYNGGQKVVFWAMFFCIALLLISGVFMWRAWFDFPNLAVRIAATAHAAVAAFMIGLVILHVYTGLWVTGTFRGMWTGRVRRAWAYQHHRAWYRRVARR